ncbi:unnamed protein product [Prunus armeniaca]
MNPMITPPKFSTCQLALGSYVCCPINLLIFVWGAAGWEKQRRKLFQIPDGKELRSLSATYIQIHQNELHPLAINKTHLAVYEVKELAFV